VGLIARSAGEAGRRREALRRTDDAWWEEGGSFFDVTRSRARVMVRRIAPTAHHRGQQTALLRVLNRDVWSTSGPTAETGGRPANQARTIDADPDLDTLLEREATNRARARRPGPGDRPPTERPEVSSH
jgi:hypothetical protein